MSSLDQKRRRDNEEYRMDKKSSHHTSKEWESSRKKEPQPPIKESDRYGKPIQEEETYTGPVEKPDFSVSGALARDQLTVGGIVLKYSEPVEGRKPNQNYRLYVFKGKELLDTLHIHRKSSYLIGRERLVADIPIDHPSCSKQHAVLQYRLVKGRNSDGIKPYILDLESSNGTFVNGSQIPCLRYYELKIGDVIKFGNSSRDYVFMKEELD